MIYDLCLGGLLLIGLFLIKYISCDSCQNDHEDRVHFEFEGGKESYGEDDIAFVVYEVLFVHE